MPDTIRQQLVTKVKTQLQAISIVNGFQTDVGVSVYEWYATSFTEADLPALILRDLDEPIEEASNHAHRHQRNLHMQVEIVAMGSTPAATYRKILADVEQAVKAGRDDSTLVWWDGLAHKTRPRLSRLVVEQESLKIAGGFYEFFIDYVTRAFDSFE